MILTTVSHQTGAFWNDIYSITMSLEMWTQLVDIKVMEVIYKENYWWEVESNVDNKVIWWHLIFRLVSNRRNRSWISKSNRLLTNNKLIILIILQIFSKLVISNRILAKMINGMLGFNNRTSNSQMFRSIISNKIIKGFSMNTNCNRK